MKNREGGAQTLQGPDWARIDAVLDRGQYLQVHDQVDGWLASGDVEAGLRAVRALRYLGAERAGDALALWLGRRHPGHAMARVVMLRAVLSQRGAFAYWQAERRWPEPAHAAPGDRADALSLRGVWLADLRDFEAAQQCHQQALALMPDDPWLHVELSYTLMRQDRYADALDAAQHALRLHPGYRAALQTCAQLLALMQRRDEALALLRDASQHAECGPLVWQLAEQLYDQGDHAGALEALEQAERCMPRADKSVQARLAARRSDALLRLDRFDAAREQAARVPGTGFYADLAQRLATGPQVQQRVLLNLEFVRQHWATCAPATLAALTRFWGWEAEHLEIAQAICYDGTTDVSERLWAQQRGFVVHEFRLDWSTACALLDAGLPFSLVTQHAGGGHLQAVVGYDRLRHTLLVRDPYQPWHAEFEANALFEQQQFNGPRAMLLLPPDQQHRLEGIALPEAQEWDLFHRLQAALDRHDRPAADQALADLRALAPDSRLAWRAARQLALYDGNEPAILAATEALLAQFPQEVNLQLSKSASLAELAGQEAAEQYLESLAGALHPEPLLMARLAGRLILDARRVPRAQAILRRALRRSPSQGRLWWQWAQLQWQAGRRDDALPAYRWAATLLATDEAAAGDYAGVCRLQGQAEAGVQFLRERERIWGDRSSAPAITLHEWLAQLKRAEEAEAVLQAALARRPQGASLKLYAAEERLRHERPDEAQALLLAATTPTRQASVLRVTALLAEARHDFDAATTAIREASQLEPFVLPHLRMLLRLLSRREGKEAALAHLRSVAGRHPAHYGLHRLLYDWLPDQAQPINEQLAHMLAYHPKDVWLHRELAVQTSRQGRHDEALACALAACELAPERADTQGTLGFVRLRREGYAAALPALRRAVVLDVDYDYGLRTLVLAAPDGQQVRAALDHVAGQLQAQAVMGDGLLCFQSIASQGWESAAVLELLRQLQAQRPEVWETWIALGRQLLEMGQSDEAHGLLVAAAQRFTVLPRVQLELAEVLRQLGRREEALKANAAALALAPSWNEAVRLQVDLIHETTAHWPEAEQLIQRALRQASDDDDLIGLLAWVNERQQRFPEALEQARRSLLLNPRPEWVWELVRRIVERTERWAEFDALLDDLTLSRPGDAWAWSVRAQQGRDDAQAVASAEQAIRLDPLLESAWLARLERLARLSRHDEIETLLRALPWPQAAPVSVRAWGARCLRGRGESHYGAAAEQLRALLQEQPNEEGLWQELADWDDEAGRHEPYLAAAREMLRLAPHRARSHTYVGHALSKLQRQAEAIPFLRRALELTPNYVFAGRLLGECAGKVGDHATVEWAAQTLWLYDPSVRTACLGINAACHARQRELALQWLDRLAGCQEYEIELTRAACGEIIAAEWGADLDTALQRAIELGQGPTGLALEWLACRRRQIGKLRTLGQVHRLMPRVKGPLLQRGVLRWLLNDDHDTLFMLFIHRFDALLRADEISWGDVGYALLNQGRERAVLRWMRDWRQHPQAPLWALANLCQCMVLRGRWEELAEVVGRALPRAPYQEDMRLWQLALQALQAGHGQLAELEHGLARCHEWTPDPWMRAALNVLQRYAAVVRERAGGHTVREFRQLPEGSEALTLALWRRLRATARWRHTPWTRLWRWLVPA